MSATIPLQAKSESGIIVAMPIPQDLIDAAVKAAMCIALREQYRNRLMALMHEVNFVRRQLGEEPRRCPHCGETLK